MTDYSIALIGPGGAGKTTIGALVAARLGIGFIDLDRYFADRNGNISEYINRFGYDAYAHTNVETYCSFSHAETAARVTALSSGFMTYPPHIHFEYARLRLGLEQDLGTFVLVPSPDEERCVAKTVRRQLARPFSRSPEKEEAVIRERFPLYVGLRARKIETMRPIAAVVDEVLFSARRA